MLKRAAATASAAVTAAVSTMGGAGSGDEVLDGYRSRLESLQREMLQLKDKCGLYSKTAMALAVSGTDVGHEFRSLYSKSAARQTQVQMFASAQRQAEEAAFRSFSIDAFGAEVLGALDEWYAESQRVQEDIRNAEAALEEVRRLQERVASLRAAKERRQQKAEANASADVLQQQAEDMLARYDRNYASQRGELDKKVTGFVEGRFAVLDAVFVRFMELQADFAQAAVGTTAAFQPTVQAYRKRFPINAAAGARSPRSGSANGLSPSNSFSGGSSTPDLLSPTSPGSSAAAQPAAASAAVGSGSMSGGAAASGGHHKKAAARAKPAAAADEEESSEEDESEEDDSDEEESEEEEERSAPQRKTLAAAAPRVSVPGSGAAAAGSPRNSQPNSPTHNGQRSNTASPDLLSFGDKQQQAAAAGQQGDGDLMNIFGAAGGGGRQKAPSPSARSGSRTTAAAAGAAADSSDPLSMFDFSGPSKPSSPTPSVPAGGKAAAGSARPPTHSSSMDFDPFAADSKPQQQQQQQPAPASSRPPPAASSGAGASSAGPGAASAALKRESSRNALNQVAKGLVKTEELDEHIAAQQEERLRTLRENEAKQESDAADKKAAVHALEDRLNAWSLKDGQRKGIRTLLSSLHTVLWPNSGWKPVGLADLIDLNAIKKVQRKAMLLVHPDKLQDATPEQKVVAEHAFDALNSAYDRFVETGQ